MSDILDYSMRVSSREAYVSPTRGAQGNALKTLIAMPYALGGELTGEGIVIESRGVVHRISFRADAIRQEPKIEHHSEPGNVKNGTRITVCWARLACSLLDDRKAAFLQTAAGYAVVNPHLSLTVQWDGKSAIQVSASDQGWRKWRACDPTSAHWYDTARLARYAAAHVARHQDLGRPPRTAREFVSEFRGLSGSAKQKAVLEESGLLRQPLSALFEDGRVRELRAAGLLRAMQRYTRPVPPRDLGVIGEGHLRRICTIAGAVESTFCYRTISGETLDHIPYVVEAAFAAAPLDSDKSRRLVLGINFAPGLGNPFRTFSTYGSYDGLETLLGEQRCGRDKPIVVVMHLACARVEYQDRGKSGVVLDRTIATDISAALATVTGRWAKQRRAEERDNHRVQREAQRERDSWQKQQEPRQRTKNAIVGSGLLHRELTTVEAEGSNCTINDLTVLSP